MKKLLFLFLLLPVMALAQNEKQDSLLGIMPQIDGKVHYQGIVKVDSVNQKTLYSRAKLFFSDIFVSGKSVIDMQDEASGIIVGKGYLAEPVPVTNVPFTFKIQVKDGRYKYDIYDLLIKTERIQCGYNLFIPETETSIEQSEYAYSKSKRVKKRLAAINAKFEALIELLKSSMQQNKAENDW